MLTGAHCAILNPRFQGYRPRWHVLDGIVPYAENDTTTWTGFPQLRRRARFASMAELPVPVERQAFWTGRKHAGAAEHQASASICLTGTRTIAIGRDRSRPR